MFSTLITAVTFMINLFNSNRISKFFPRMLDSIVKKLNDLFHTIVSKTSYGCSKQGKNILFMGRN